MGGASRAFGRFFTLMQIAPYRAYIIDFDRLLMASATFYLCLPGIQKHLFFVLYETLCMRFKALLFSEKLCLQIGCMSFVNKLYPVLNKHPASVPRPL